MLTNLLVALGFKAGPLELHPQTELPGVLAYHKRISRGAYPEVDCAAGKANSCTLVLDANRDGYNCLVNMEIG